MEKDKTMIFALDAGHGFRSGKPSGGCAHGLCEDEIALDMVRRIGHFLRADGHQTIYTRPSSAFVNLRNRGLIARKNSCGFFLSIHCNAGPSAAEGIEAYVAEGDGRSRKIAAKILAAVGRFGMKNRGVKWDCSSQHSRLKVLRDTYKLMPSILLEIGFLTNGKDSALLKNKLFRDNAARSIAEVLMQA